MSQPIPEQNTGITYTTPDQSEELAGLGQPSGFGEGNENLEQGPNHTGHTDEPIKVDPNTGGFTQAEQLPNVLLSENGSEDLGSSWVPQNIKNPENWNGCEKCAQDIQSGIGGEIIRIKPMDGIPSLGGFKGSNPGWAHHEVVVKEGRVYDAFGPSEGLTIQEYKDQFQYSDAIDFGF